MGHAYDEATDDYHREPYVADVSEGKNDPIYNAHPYHTKVPYKAIIPFIEHYTEPGDIVFDGFCGTGMTGVAAQMVNRRAILCDLSPAAAFIAYNYNTPVDVQAFEREAQRILEEVEAECGWMYETKHTDGRTGRINYTVWSDVFICPYCQGEIVFWDAAVDAEAGKIYREFKCPNCSAELKKSVLSRATELIFDSVLNRKIERDRQIPVLINFSADGEKYDKRPTQDDLDLIEKVETSEIPYWFPTNPMDPNSDRWADDAYYLRGITHIHQFYPKRNLWVLASLSQRIAQSNNPFLRHAFTGVIQGLTRLQRFRPKSTFPNMILSGTLYIGSLTREWNTPQWFEGKLRGLRRSLKPRQLMPKVNFLIVA